MMRPVDTIHAAVARLVIDHPDPDEYDRGFNAAVRVACETIAAVAAGAAARTASPPPLLGGSPLQRRIVAALRAHGSAMDESAIRAALFPTMPPDHRPRITAALGALQRASLVRRLAGGHPRYVLT